MNTKALALIDKFYEQGALRDLLLTHSISVTRKALRIAYAHPELNIDVPFVEEAAMLHDIGIICCDAPGIGCHGTEPYIRHGVMGAIMLRAEGMPRHARVCERHTGAGITVDNILRQHLPLAVPHDATADTGTQNAATEPYMPETIEEQLICYADKFFSKSKPDREKTIEQAAHSLAKFGKDGVKRFLAWTAMFE